MSVQPVIETRKPLSVELHDCLLIPVFSKLSIVHRPLVLCVTVQIMHPFGGVSVCPRCEKTVYAAEQVRPITLIFVPATREF